MALRNGLLTSKRKSERSGRTVSTPLATASIAAAPAPLAPRPAARPVAAAPLLLPPPPPPPPPLLLPPRGASSIVSLRPAISLPPSHCLVGKQAQSSADFSAESSGTELRPRRIQRRATRPSKTTRFSRETGRTAPQTAPRFLGGRAHSNSRPPRARHTTARFFGTAVTST